MHHLFVWYVLSWTLSRNFGHHSEGMLNLSKKGINDESSFEAALLERTQHCELWGYDFSVSDVCIRFLSSLPTFSLSFLASRRYRPLLCSPVATVILPPSLVLKFAPFPDSEAGHISSRGVSLV